MICCHAVVVSRSPSLLGSARRFGKFGQHDLFRACKERLCSLTPTLPKATSAIDVAPPLLLYPIPPPAMHSGRREHGQIVAGIGTCGCLFVTNYELFRIMRERAASVGDNIRSVSFFPVFDVFPSELSNSYLTISIFLSFF